MEYRREIDGLRALAVLPVVFFHAGFTAFSGGFIGVDVFFVISGYLITGILVNDMAAGRFSIADFYERRVRRIIPALYFVMLCCIPFTWAWMLPGQMKDFSSSLMAVVFFVSNVFFSKSTGYFDTAAEEKPLLHTWSLAVEEQYYIFFPLLLMWLFRRKKQERVLLVLTCLAVGSLVFAEWSGRKDAAISFFQTTSRAWELLAGAVAALIVRQKGTLEQGPLAFLGLMGVTVPIFFYDANTPFPGIYAIPPVLGVCLILIFAGPQTATHKLLGSTPLRGIGLVSYSAYLWHQPLFAFARIQTEEQAGPSVFMALTGATLVLAVISWKFIEAPFRDRNLFSRRTLFGSSLFLGMAIFVFGFLGRQSNGFMVSRYSTTEVQILSQEYNVSSRLTRLGAPEEPESWALIGDSHANTLLESLDAMFKRMGGASVVKTRDGCPPALMLVRHDKNTGHRCHEHYEAVLKALQEKSIRNVLLLSRWPLYLNSARFNNMEGGVEQGEDVIYDHLSQKTALRPLQERSIAVENQMVDYVERLSDLGIRTYVLTSIPEVGWNTPKVAYLNRQQGGEIKTRRVYFDDRNAATQGFFRKIAAIPRVKIIDISNALCDQDFCYATASGIPLYFDTNHPNRTGAQHIVEKIAATLGQPSSTP